MRISDWSSDVCSSDLDMLFKQQANWTSAEDPIAAIKQIGRLAGIRGETADACMSDEALLDGILKIRLGGQQDHDISRSEEHTSELQSLMRISYAVFCLKKKKHE